MNIGRVLPKSSTLLASRCFMFPAMIRLEQLYWIIHHLLLKKKCLLPSCSKWQPDIWLYDYTCCRNGESSCPLVADFQAITHTQKKKKSYKAKSRDICKNVNTWLFKIKQTDAFENTRLLISRDSYAVLSKPVIQYFLSEALNQNPKLEVNQSS